MCVDVGIYMGIDMFKRMCVDMLMHRYVHRQHTSRQIDDYHQVYIHVYAPVCMHAYTLPCKFTCPTVCEYAYRGSMRI